MARILLVDDDKEFGAIFRRVVESEGHSVSVSLSVLGGLGILRNEKFDLVFADLSLPGENGMVLLEKSKKDYPGLPVVIITAFGDWGSYAEAVEKGADSFLNKPAKKEEILKVINEISR
ncbi:MAG: response regulator [Candidatus Omnitrophota bacterium]